MAAYTEDQVRAKCELLLDKTRNSYISFGPIVVRRCDPSVMLLPDTLDEVEVFVSYETNIIAHCHTLYTGKFEKVLSRLLVVINSFKQETIEELK